MDFYKQRRFNDQITGQSGMTFFEAHKSEVGLTHDVVGQEALTVAANRG